MECTAINLKEKLSKFSEHWSPKIIARMNDYHFKLAKFSGGFVWHCHDETDEVFTVLEGKMSIQFRDGQVDLSAGELFVVHKGVEHNPFAEKECQSFLLNLQARSTRAAQAEKELLRTMYGYERPA